MIKVRMIQHKEDPEKYPLGANALINIMLSSGIIPQKYMSEKDKRLTLEGQRIDAKRECFHILEYLIDNYDFIRSIEGENLVRVLKKRLDNMQN